MPFPRARTVADATQATTPTLMATAAALQTAAMAFVAPLPPTAGSRASAPARQRCSCRQTLWCASAAPRSPLTGGDAAHLARAKNRRRQSLCQSDRRPPATWRAFGRAPRVPASLPTTSSPAPAPRPSHDRAASVALVAIALYAWRRACRRAATAAAATAMALLTAHTANVHDAAPPDAAQWAAHLASNESRATAPPPMQLRALVPPAHAVSGMVRFPLETPLANRYYLARAGETLPDADGVIDTNPVDKISQQHSGLTRRGAAEARTAAYTLVDKLDFCAASIAADADIDDAIADGTLSPTQSSPTPPSKLFGVGGNCWIWPSTTLNAYETAEVIALAAHVPRERVVPEFAFLDKRGFGALNGRSAAQVEPNVRVHDANERGYYRPPAGDDGTPDESVHDVLVRVRQLLSKLETQYNGQDIVIVASDTYPVSVLECVMRGEPPERYTQYLYKPGEVRQVEGKVVQRAPLPTLPLERDVLKWRKTPPSAKAAP